MFVNFAGKVLFCTEVFSLTYVLGKDEVVSMYWFDEWFDKYSALIFVLYP